MSAYDPELLYLEPGFDPASLTVPRLRSILLERDVHYSSSAKKPELVALFNEHVAPQARRILKAQRTTKRSERGIVDMPSSRENSVATDTTEDSEEEAVAPLPAPDTTRRRSTRTRSSVSATPDPDMTPVARPAKTPSKTPAKRPSTKHARTSEVDQEERPSTRRSTRPSATPSVKAEDPDDESPFTQDNPFQSGTPPSVEPKSERRRQTLGLSQQRERRKSNASRRRTDISRVDRHEHQDDNVVVPSSKTFSPPKPRAYRAPSPEEEPAEETSETEDEQVEAGEEFTPEESLALVRQRAKEGKADILPPRRKPAKKSSNVPKSFVFTSVLAFVGGFATWWRQEKIAVGYCGIGSPSLTLGNVEIPEWVEPIRPQCEPCPAHAYCYADLQTQCEKGFILTPHPLSLNGMVPLPPTCEPDSKQARRIKTVADRGVEELRERNAKYECGEPDAEGNQLPNPELYEEELKQTLLESKSKSITQDEFDDLWNEAIGDMLSRDEVVSSVEGEEDGHGHGGHRKLASNSLAKCSFACTLRRSVRVAVAEHIGQLVGLAAILLAVAGAQHSLTTSRATERKAKQLASDVLDRLALHASLHAADPRGHPEPFLSMGNLRDDILRSEFSAARRQKLWARVQKKVEQNLNVRSSVRESRSGDVVRVWEWVGAVKALEGASPAGRIGFGESPKGREMGMTVQGWDEGRPVC